MANTLMVADRSDDARALLPVGLELRVIAEGDLADVGWAYWRAYLGSAEEMSQAQAVEDVAAAWRGEYGRWLGEGCLLARWHGDLVGAILTVDDAPWPDVPRGAFITDLFVVPQARRRGAGRALVQAVQCAIAAGIGLRVDDTAQAARALYASLGFHPVT